MERELYVITGVTAVGKTEAGLRWAEENNGEILSCDSLLVYKGMDIGTAKPTKEELERVVHYGIDVVPVRKQFSVSEYVELAKKAVEEIERKGKRVVVLGGSGFYLQSFYGPVVDEIEVNEEIRVKARGAYEERGLEYMVGWLRELNGGGLEGVVMDFKNPRRVVRAVERCLASGKGLVEIMEDFKNAGYPFEGYKKHTVIMDRGSEEMEGRIRLRVKQMVREGLIEEVRRLMGEGILENPSAAMAIGYRETIRWIEEGEVDLGKLEEEIVRDTKQLVGKQRKWFKRFKRLNLAL